MIFKHENHTITRSLNELAREYESARNIRSPTAPQAHKVAHRLVKGELDVLEWSRMHPHFRDLVVRTAVKIDTRSSEFDTRLAACLSQADRRLDDLKKRTAKKISRAAPNLQIYHSKGYPHMKEFHQKLTRTQKLLAFVIATNICILGVHTGTVIYVINALNR